LNRPDIEIGDALQEFKEFTSAFPSELRGEALSNSGTVSIVPVITVDLIRATHNSFARSDPFQSDETRAATDDDDVFHFISFAVINGSLLELDGLQSGPINHGPCTDDSFPDTVLSLLRDRISNHFSTGEIRFNLLAVTRDPRIALREHPSPENTQLLENEERKRKRWTRENSLRRHNFVNMVYLVAKAAVEQEIQQNGNIDALIDTGKKNAQRRREFAEGMKKMKGDRMDTS
jgi:ubiquitin carboxyl-terminal hydrolase L5